MKNNVIALSNPTKGTVALSLSKCSYMKWGKTLSFFGLVVLLFSCNQKPEATSTTPEEENTFVFEKTKAEEIKELKEAGFQIFEFMDEDTGDTIIMKQYFMAFLKRGPNRDQTKEEADSLQALHMEHLGRMYEEGYADISGPFGDDGDLRGITIYNVPTLQMADSLANLDPMMQSGRLMVEIKPWWAGMGYPLR